MVLLKKKVFQGLLNILTFCRFIRQPPHNRVILLVLSLWGVDDLTTPTPSQAPPPWDTRTLVVRQLRKSEDLHHKRLT